MARVTYLALCVLVLSSCYVEGWFFFSSSSSSSSSGGGGGGSSSFPHDIDTQSGLTSLYNKRVVHVDHYERPLSGLSTMFGPFRHSGVVVTTDDGDKWLVHKGDGYGISSQTVVTNAKHMSDKWHHVTGHDVSNSRVSDYVRAGGSHYNIFTDNCNDGRCRMMELP